ncbi:sigma 54-interacting transcriptional regulator [Geomonas sp. Red69]|uniref:Sigma 54-interacting transcriptional regulator n=1 Tax=Geomonas diazotrophica TaxID=2843197 RepID=A0ABX8JL63_9BACT|nr:MULTISPECIES: sigma 54-interacting transcriptional regulator [Geomonas]MBU5638969.1 sigma 54-interacting transcriptional regulator [Geomonas diazotrophica]QWV98721.1 sigma 54-interacting transcriptional regulator [Geomonas nitrogeniifigens]QXE87878.1 sigma 54-interacting transcriptional regulator [Geomonas nitrogeniifigens]
MTTTESEPGNAVYRAILTSMGEGIIFADHTNKIVCVNAAAEQIRGIDAANYLGRDLLAIHSPPARPRIGAILESLKGGTLAFHTRPLEVKGRIFENSYYPIKDALDRFVGTLMVSRDITEREHLKEENSVLRDQLLSESSFGGMIGRSPAMQPVFQMIRSTAPLDSTILITGESGTGKELVARELHGKSRRSGSPLIKINCAALPENLLESELFGFEKGAFTGAFKERKGKFEQAHRGTLFLDEIGELPLSAQAKLLRVLQEKTVERIGGNREIQVDVRIVAATNRDLRHDVAAGQFREDLFYRLNVIPIELPPLRERLEDILPLVTVFLSRFATDMGRPELRLSREAKEALLSHRYPGNVRELKNAMERATALCSGDTLTIDDLPAEFRQGSFAAQAEESEPPHRPAQGSLLSTKLDDKEEELIRQALAVSGNRRAEAARLLGISRKTLWKKMKRYR